MGHRTPRQTCRRKVLNRVHELLGQGYGDCLERAAEEAGLRFATVRLWVRQDMAAMGLDVGTPEPDLRTVPPCGKQKIDEVK